MGQGRGGREERKRRYVGASRGGGRRERGEKGKALEVGCWVTRFAERRFGACEEKHDGELAIDPLASIPHTLSCLS